MGKKKAKEPSTESDEEEDDDDRGTDQGSEKKSAQGGAASAEAPAAEPALKAKTRSLVRRVELLLAPLLLAYCFPRLMKRLATRRTLQLTLLLETLIAGLRLAYLLVFYEALCQLYMKIISGLICAVSFVGLYFVSTRNVVKCRGYARLSFLAMVGVVCMMVAVFADDACECASYHECYKLDKIAEWFEGGTVFNPYTPPGASKGEAVAITGYSHFPREPRWKGMAGVTEDTVKLPERPSTAYPTHLLEQEPPKATATLEQYCELFKDRANPICSGSDAEPTIDAEALAKAKAEQAQVDDEQAIAEARGGAELEVAALLDTGFVVDARGGVVDQAEGLRRIGERVSLHAERSRTTAARAKRLLQGLRERRLKPTTRTDWAEIRPASRSEAQGASLVEEAPDGEAKQEPPEPAQDSPEWAKFKEQYQLERAKRKADYLEEVKQHRRDQCHCEVQWSSTAPPCKRTPTNSEHGPWRYWCYVDPESAAKDASGNSPCKDVKYSVIGNDAQAWTFEACEEEETKGATGEKVKHGRCDCIQNRKEHQMLPAMPPGPESISPKQRQVVAGTLEDNHLTGGQFGIGCRAWTHPYGVWNNDPKDEIWDDLVQEGAHGPFVNYKFSASWCFVDSDSACPYIGRMVADEDSGRTESENAKVTLLFSWWPCRKQEGVEWTWKQNAEKTCFWLWTVTLVNMLVLFLLQWMRMSVLAMFIQQQCFDSSVLTVDASGPALQTVAAGEDLWGESDDDFDDGVDDDDDEDDDDDAGKKRKK